MLSTSVIILEHVCPALGVVVANYLFTAPVKDCYLAVKAGKGLGDLNPTPWAFCTGNCIGWITYGILKQNVYILVGNSPGFLLSVWLNMQAAKLQYEGFRSKEMITSLLKSLEQSPTDEETLQSHALPQDSAPPIAATEVGTGNTATARAIAIVRELEAESMNAPASHDVLVMANVTLWLVVISIICYGSSISDEVKEFLVGVIVNLNLVIFYASPLSIICTVLTTRNSATIHIPTMMGITLNGSFWAVYGIAVLDAFIAVPNGLGALLGFVQVFLCVVFPRHAPTPSAATTDEGDSDPQAPAIQPASVDDANP